jgi:hypothetical protein
MVQNGRVSPRHSSQKSQSDQSKHSVSPRHNQAILPNVLIENGAKAGSSLPQRTPQQVGQDSHAAKVARMEASASQGYTGGIPTKIDEDVEPE